MSVPTATPGTRLNCFDYASCLPLALNEQYQACLQNPPGGDQSKCQRLSPTDPFPSNPPPLPSVPSDSENACTKANGDFQGVALRSADKIKDFVTTTSDTLTKNGKDTLGKNKCTNGQVTAASGFQVPFVNIGTTVNTQFSTGCSQIALQYAVQTSISNSLQCLCTSIKTSTQSSLTAFNSIKIKGGNIHAAGDVNINSRSENQQIAKVVNFLSAQVQTQLKQTIQTSLKAVNDSLLKQENSMTPPNAQKSLAMTMAAALSNSANLNMTSIINQIGLSVNAQNQYELDLSNTYAGGNINVNITQNNYQDVMLENITKAVMDTIMENATITSAISENSTIQSQANKGLMSLFGTSKGIGVIIAIIIVLVLLGAGLIFYFTQKSGTATLLVPPPK
ncbi:hypothetical protein EBZ80_04915 [bacterium]|nr:hypothetical protein [bacterium]